MNRSPLVITMKGFKLKSDYIVHIGKKEKVEPKGIQTITVELSRNGERLRDKKLLSIKNIIKSNGVKILYFIKVPDYAIKKAIKKFPKIGKVKIMKFIPETGEIEEFIG